MRTRHPKTIDFWRGDLPHWQVEDGRYFVTIHLSGAIPKVGRIRIKKLAEMSRDGNEGAGASEQALRIGRRVFIEMETWLDRMSPVAKLKNREMACMVIEAIEHRQNKNIWNMFEYVVMPSHIHLFFELNNELSLKRELSEFKRWTGHKATKNQPDVEQARFWQTEWFDHWSRSNEEDEKIIWYIRRNPVVANLVTAYQDFAFRGSLAKY
jgi:REP element-mobilizing transposase RayT